MRGAVPAEELTALGAIILAGTYHGTSAFGAVRPRALLPVAQRPLIEYVLGWLQDSGVSTATICANGSTGHLRAHLGDGRAFGVTLGYHEDGIPRGAAGCVKDASRLNPAQTLIVTDSSSIPVADLRGLVAQHRRTGASVTIAVQRQASNGGEPVLEPTGLYLFERNVLEMVPSTSFQDIKESLIPKLYRAGCAVEVFEIEGASPRVLNAQTYLAANYWMIARLAAAARNVAGRCDMLAHPSAWVDPTATILGPVLLGPDVRIHEGALVVGPACIGAGTVIEAGAVVTRSVLWDHCHVGAQAIVDQSVIADYAAVGSGMTVSSALRTTPSPVTVSPRQPSTLWRRGIRPRSGALPKPALS